jgi:protein involved in polysaccharide export with SLBB domain
MPTNILAAVARRPVLALIVMLGCAAASAQKITGPALSLGEGGFGGADMGAVGAAGVDGASLPALPSADAAAAAALASTSSTYAPIGPEGPPAPSSTPSAPLPPSSFQRFVQASTGQALPLFGADYFQLPPSTFAPTRSGGVPADYTLGPGDEIAVRVTGVLELTLRLVVDPSGRVVLPKVGPVALAGVKAGELEGFLTRELSRSFRNFTLTATLTGLRSIDVYVVGQARQPGKHTIGSMSSLVNALFTTGGPSAEGTLRRIQLLRAGVVVAEFDLYRFITTGRKDGDVHVQSGDTLFFPVAGPRVAVVGAVRTSAVFELREADESIGSILALQGGVPTTATTLRAHLERVDGRRPVARSVVDVALDDAGLAQPLFDGDVLTVFATSPEIGNAVTLRGNVASPGRYPWVPGMRVRDLLPTREALVVPGYHERKNRLVKQGEPGVETARQEVKSLIDEVNWDYAIVERLDKDAVAMKLLPFHLGRAVIDGAERDNLVLQAGDIVTIFGEGDITVPQQRRTRLVRVEGEVGAPGVYQLLPGETLPSLLQRVGGITAEAWLYGATLRRASVREMQRRTLERVTRELEARARADLAARRANLRGTDTALQQAQLQAEEKLIQERIAQLRAAQPDGRIALELDPQNPVLPAVVLEDGDGIVVPTRPSFVLVVGAAHSESSLLWRSDRTVADYLQSSGLPERADRDGVFVVRADGSVRARGQGLWGWWGNPVLGMALEPGDVVVVPERMAREEAYTAFVRELKDWTQILANAGVTAAVIGNLLR